MRIRYLVSLVMAAVVLLWCHAASAESHRIGAGVHYWTTVDKIDVSDVDENGFAWIVSYQYAPAVLIKLEADMEIFPADFGGSEEVVLAPQVFAILGGTIYGALGAGIFYTDGDFADSPFYVLRAGLDLEMLPGLFIDINANYHFTDFKSISGPNEDIDTDTITLGAVLRIAY